MVGTFAHISPYLLGAFMFALACVPLVFVLHDSQRRSAEKKRMAQLRHPLLLGGSALAVMQDKDQGDASQGEHEGAQQIRRDMCEGADHHSKAPSHPLRYLGLAAAPRRPRSKLGQAQPTLMILNPS